MRKQDLVTKKERLDRLFEYYDRLPATEPELRAHWVRYLVVLTSGYLETSVSYIYSGYAEGKSAPRIIRYIAARLESPGNLKMVRLERLIREFGDDWFDELKTRPDFDQIRSAVDSVVSNRNNVAHGDEISTTIRQLREYYDVVVTLVDILYEQCDRETHAQRWTRKQRRDLGIR